MKLFTTKQIAEIDKYTIENEPVADIDLMERAAMQITNWIVKHFSAQQKMVFFAGPGNNGGDALAIARQLAELDYSCELYLLDFGKDLKGSPKINRQRLEEQNKVKTGKIKDESDFPELLAFDIIIDGLFGSGLSRPLENLPVETVKYINRQNNTVIAIDIPSGLMGEDNSENISENIIQADFTLTFQFPKISFLFAENEKFTGKWEVLSIGLHPDGIEKIKSFYFFPDREMIKKLIPKRSNFSHKGTFGHALLIAGSFGKMGAAVLASKACCRAGAGLVTAHIPRLGYPIIQTAVPEVMTSVDQHDSVFTEAPDLKPFSAIGIGPGLDKKRNTCKALYSLLETIEVPLLIDADGLNILSENKEWLKNLPENTILTPHPGEFRRLAGESANSYEQMKKQLDLAKEFKVIVVLKGAFTSIATPEGKLYFNPTGNPGLATGGSGDVLTGIILGLLAQRFKPEDAALAGVYLHGLAADIAVKQKSLHSLIAGDVTKFLGQAFLQLEE
jgi:NAD(P)H-hydrate epimerase